MNEQPAGREDSQSPTTPFDDFSEKQGDREKRSLHLAPIATPLRIISAIAMAAAVASAVAIILLDAFHWFEPGLSWRLKSAVPLISIGVSYAVLQFTVPRTLVEFLMGLGASTAFVLWGAEQFIPAPKIASLVDDFVVLLFVIDLGVVIRGHLRRSREPK